MNKKLLCALTAICLLFSTQALAENVEDTLSIGIMAPRTTDIRPLTPLDRDMISLYAVVYESLVTVDDNGVPQPLLAESWVESGNGKTWTFTLRDRVFFSDGTPLTAHDVVASGQRLLDMANNSDSSQRGFYQNIRYLVSSFRATDDRTIVVRGERNYYGLLYSMTFPVIPASQIDMVNPVGSGPYQFTNFQGGGDFKLDLNPYWWQTEPQVKTITGRNYLNSKALITAYEFNEVDLVFTRSVAAAQYKSGISTLSIHYATRQLETLLINNRDSAGYLNNVQIRQAIRYAIDIDKISRNAYMGMTSKADTPVPADSWLYYDQENKYGYNPEKAAQLLADLGWEDTNQDGFLDMPDGEKSKRLHLRIYVYEDPENDVRIETANLIEEMLNAVKISVKVETMSYEAVKEKLEAHSFDLVLCGFQMDVVPDPGFFLLRSNQQNYVRYSSDEMNKHINDLRKSYNAADFAYATQAIQQQFAEDLPFICLFYRTGAVLTRKMYTSVRVIREFELLRGIEAFGR